MKKCTSCGNSYDIPGNFCPQCGGQLVEEPASAPQVQAQPTVTGYTVTQNEFTTAPAPAKAKGKVNKKILIPIIAVVAVIALVVGGIAIFGAVSGANGPVTKVYSSVIDIFTSGDTYAVEFSGEIDGYKVSGDGLFFVNQKDKEAGFEGSAKVDGEEGSAFGYINEKDEYVAFEAFYMDEYFYVINDCYGDNDRFSYQEEFAEKTAHMTAETIFNLLPLLEDPTKIDADAIKKALPSDLNDLIDDDEFAKASFNLYAGVFEICGSDIVKKLGDEKWLEEEMGYTKSSKDGTVHSFDFSCDAPINALVEIMEEHEEEITPIIEEYEKAMIEYYKDNGWDHEISVDFDDFIDTFEDIADDAEEIKVEFAATLKGKELKKIEISINAYDDEILDFEVEFEKSKEKIDVDKDKYDKIYNELVKLAEERENANDNDYDYDYNYDDEYYGDEYYGDEYYGDEYYGDEYYGDEYYGDEYYGDEYYGDEYYGDEYYYEDEYYYDY